MARMLFGTGTKRHQPKKEDFLKLLSSPSARKSVFLYREKNE